MNNFKQETPMIQQSSPASYNDRQFLHTFLAGLLLPLAQATAVAVMAFVGTITLRYALNSVDLFKPSLVVAVFTWIGTFLFLMRRWLTLTSFERLTGLDINRDGQIGAPVKKPAEKLVIRLDEVGGNGHYRSRDIRLDVTASQLRELGRGLLAGRPFTEREWTGPGNPFSSGPEGTFRPLRAEWLKHGLLEAVSDKDNRAGFDLTAAGWAMIEKLAQVEAEEEAEVDPPSDDEWEAIERENAAYAEKYQS